MTGYPSAALVNPKGVVVWQGHPSGLQKDKLENHLAGAMTTPTVRSAKVSGDGLVVELEIDGLNPGTGAGFHDH